jgi:hypothetical protein
MVQLTLGAHEVAALTTALKSYLGDLHSEIAGTDSFDFREGLKQQEATLQSILGQLEHTGGDAAVQTHTTTDDDRTLVL